MLLAPEDLIWIPSAGGIWRTKPGGATSNPERRLGRLRERQTKGSTRPPSLPPPDAPPPVAKKVASLRRTVKRHKTDETHRFSVAASKRRTAESGSEGDDRDRDAYMVDVDEDDTYGNEQEYDPNPYKDRSPSPYTFSDCDVDDGKEFIYVKRICAIFKGLPQDENRVAVPIEINGQRYTVLERQYL